jgi:O-antigen/teichoic acid export membrane protein
MPKSRLSKNVVVNYFGLIFQIILALFLSPFLINTLGDTKYGIWSIAAAFTGYMSLLDLGLSSAVNRYVSKYSSLSDQDSVNQVISTASLMFFILGVIAILVSPIMAEIIVNWIGFDNEYKGLVYVLIIVVSFDVGIFIISNLYKGIFGGLQRYDITNIVLMISSTLKASLFFFYLSNGYDLIAMGLISLSANIFSILLLYLILRKKYPKFYIKISYINRPMLKKIVNFSKFSFLAMLSNQIIYYSDAFVIGYFMSAAAVTYYSIPWSLSEYTKKMCLSISRSYTPLFSEYEARNSTEKIVSSYIQGTKLILFFSNLFSIGFLFLGSIFIGLWIGPRYEELCHDVLIVLFISQLVTGPQLISYSLLQGISKQKRYAQMNMMVSVLNLALSIILVQQYGIVGVALGVAVPQIVFNGLLVPLYTLKVIGIRPIDYIKKTYLLSILPSIILVFFLYIGKGILNLNNILSLLVLAVFGFFAYSVSSYYSLANNDEREYVKSFFFRKKLIK